MEIGQLNLDPRETLVLLQSSQALYCEDTLVSILEYAINYYDGEDGDMAKLVSTLDDKIMSLEHDLHAAKAEITDKQNQLTELKYKIEENDEVIEHLEKRIDELETKNARLIREIKEWEEEAKDGAPCG